MILQIVNGLVFGGLLYHVSVGPVLIIGLRRVVNFAHGGLFRVGHISNFQPQSLSISGLGSFAVIARSAFGIHATSVATLPKSQKKNEKSWRVAIARDRHGQRKQRIRVVHGSSGKYRVAFGRKMVAFV